MLQGGSLDVLGCIDALKTVLQVLGFLLLLAELNHRPASIDPHCGHVDFLHVLDCHLSDAGSESIYAGASRRFEDAINASLVGSHFSEGLLAGRECGLVTVPACFGLKVNFVEHTQVGGLVWVCFLIEEIPGGLRVGQVVLFRRCGRFLLIEH